VREIDMPQTFGVSKWGLPEIVFVVAAAFAMGAIGFFFAIYLQLHSTSTGLAGVQEIPADAKAKVMEQGAAQIASENQAQTAVEQHAQYDPTDSRAAAKIKLMQQAAAQH
jgi:hypothetical protein